MNRGEIRAAIFAQADWEPNPSSAEVTRTNDFINRAADQVCLEAPFLFHESEIRFATQEDILPKAADTVSFAVVDTTPTAGANAWVLRQTAQVGKGDNVQWAINRTWDGRIIEIDTADGTVYRNRIRTVWKEEVGSVFHFQLSLFKPWPIDVLGNGPFKYRIYTEHYYLPDDMVQLKSARLFKSSFNWPLSVIGQDEAEKRSLSDRRTVIAAGQPRAMWRRAHRSIQGPSVAPDATTVFSQPLNDDWVGPEPPGSFQYIITYTWGKRDINLRNPGTGFYDHQSPEWLDDGLDPVPSRPEFGDDRVREPLWESSPSPATPVVVVNPMQEVGLPQPGVKLTVPNIEYMQGFLLAGTDSGFGAYSRANKARSGWHVRIYRKRVTEDFSGYSFLSSVGRDATGLRKLDLSDAYYLLAEMRLDEFNGGIFIDNGAIIPDFHKRLRDIHGYQAIQLYPKPDKRYEVDIRCIRRPQKMDTDQDVPPVHAEATDLIIHRALMLFYEHLGNPAMAEMARSRYERNLATATKRYSDLRPPAEPIRRQMSRARRGVAAQGGIRRWWKTDV